MKLCGILAWQSKQIKVFQAYVNKSGAIDTKKFGSFWPSNTVNKNSSLGEKISDFFLDFNYVFSYGIIMILIKNFKHEPHQVFLRY